MAVPRTGVAVPRTYPGRYYRPYSYPRYYYPFYPRYYYSPWYYGSYYAGFGFGFGFGWPGVYWGAYGYPYGYGYPYAYRYAYPYPYPYYWYDNTGSARLSITPRNAQVYVDGQFVGLVDEFDGSFQRLHLGIGEHELQVYLEGYRTLTEKALFTRGTTIKIERALQPLAPGEPAEPKPAPNRAPRPADVYQRERTPPTYRGGERAAFGTLSLRVNPSDAVILIDGEAWERPEGENRFSIDLSEGPHGVEVRKEGYRPYVRTVDVHRGQTFTLNVSLTTRGPGPVPINARR